MFWDWIFKICSWYNYIFSNYNFLFSLFHILNLSSNIILFVLFLIFIYSFYAISKYIKGNETRSRIVVDEFIEQSIPIYLFEISHGTIKDTQEAVLFYLYIFILFRFFDIKKPFQ